MTLRILLPIISAVFIAVTTACSNDAERSKPVRVGVSQCSADEWRTRMNHELQREAMLHPEVQLTVKTAHDNNGLQSAQIDSLVSQGIDVLIVSPNEADAVTPAIERARAKGIKVVAFDRKINGDAYDAWIGADNAIIGGMAAFYLGSQAVKKPLRVLELQGRANSSAASERHAGLASQIAQNPRIRLLEPVRADWTADGAARVMRNWLNTNNIDSVDYVFAHNDRMALAARQAVIEHLAKQGKPLRTRFIGIDAISRYEMPDTTVCYGADNVATGELEATITYPSDGEEVLRLALEAANGRQVAPVTFLPAAIINSQNVPLVLMQAQRMAQLDNKLQSVHQNLDNSLKEYASQTPVLWLVVALLAILFVLTAVVVRNFWIKKSMNDRLTLDKLDLQERLEQLTLLQHKLEEATNAKLIFFTNVSHDFRTPLTLIADPIDQLKDREDLPDDARQILQMASRNTQILKRLVNQILDFRKYENGNLVTNLQPIEIDKSIEQWCRSFAGIAARRDQTLTLKIGETPAQGWNVDLDAEKTERIIFNLLSNAVKYTPQGGSIGVDLTTCEDDETRKIMVRVCNSGPGIEAAHLEHIFDRLYQVDHHNPGSGIGLALVKAFAEIQGGTIAVTSETGQNTCFTLTLPYVPTSAKPVAKPPVPTQNIEGEVPSIKDQPADDTRPTVLVVDDNADIRQYLRMTLQKDYNVVEAADGQQGLDTALAIVPDIVVCDVMMPVLDGMQCCRRIKESPATSHILVVMLTACNLDEQRARGYECGADSYLSKPFTCAVLTTRLANLLASRKRLTEIYGDRALIRKANISATEKDFATRLRDALDAHMADADFDVDALADAMALSRVQLYRKIKSLTGGTPTDLLRKTRLMTAKAMLDKGAMTVAEVAYACGFGSPSYFAKCYRDEFGCAPSAQRRGEHTDR